MSNSATPRRIGLIGLGLMGRPMGMNLLKAGHKLTVWNRTASRAQELVGASLAKTPREAAAGAEILLTMVSDPPALEEVLWGHEGRNDGALGGLRAGSIYIDSSTVSPALVRKIAAACAERRVRFLDAPVTGGDWGALEFAAAVEANAAGDEGGGLGCARRESGVHDRRRRGDVEGSGADPWSDGQEVVSPGAEWRGSNH